MRTLILALLLAVPAGAQLAQLDSPPLVVSIGGEQIAIPAPKGAADPSRSAPRLRETAEMITPPINRLLANFVLEDDLRAALKGRETAFERYFLAQTPRRAEDDRVSRNDFAMLRATLHKQQKEMLAKMQPRVNELLEQTSKDVSRRSGSPTSLAIGEVVPIGVVDESDDKIIFGFLSEVRVKQGGREESQAIVNVSAIVQVKTKVVFLYTYSAFRGPADVEWAKQAAREWADRVLLANR